MSDKVIGLRGHVPDLPDREPRAEVVTAARHLLELAEAGEITALAYATRHHDDLTSYCTNGIVSRALIGAVALLQADLVDHIREDD
jgi:hypothetical protein